MTVVFKGVAHPWQCDFLGHLTTRFYTALFDDASYHFLYEVFGWTGSSDDEGKLGWVDVRHVTNYQAEVPAGGLLEVSAGIRKIGGKSITFAYDMKNLGTGDMAATLESVCVLFDLHDRKAVAIPDALRAKAEAYLEPQEDES